MNFKGDWQRLVKLTIPFYNVAVQLAFRYRSIHQLATKFWKLNALLPQQPMINTPFL